MIPIQKKAKRFRYLSKDMVKNPLIYLHQFFYYETNLHYWLNDINVFVNAGAYPELSCPDELENGFHCRQMIQQIEIAYVIFKQCKLEKQKQPLNLFPTREDYYNYVTSGQYTHRGEVNPSDSLSKFFSFQSLDEWYDTLDDLWMYQTTGKSNDYDNFGDKIVAIKELLFRMVHALHNIWENEGLFVSVPSYFLAEQEEPHDAKIPKSRLGEYLDKTIDENRQKLKEEADTSDDETEGATDDPAEE